MQRFENLLGSAYLKLTQAASHRIEKFNLFLDRSVQRTNLSLLLFVPGYSPQLL